MSQREPAKKGWVGYAAISFGLAFVIAALVIFGIPFVLGVLGIKL